jgi:His/Glu/Gln/Arg/opine family amino acid ABC transporter permease subunit
MAQAAVDPISPPDVRGPTAPFPASVFGAGIAALAAVLGGTVVLQILYAFWGGPVTQECVAEGLEPGTIIGARGVCHIVEAVRSPAQTALLVLGIGLGVGAIAAGFSRYKQMPTKRQREQCIAGAVLGIQAIAIAGFVFLFRGGQVVKFARNFLNFEAVSDQLGGFATGAKYTLILAFAGQIGGIIIGLILAVLALSKRRTVRAPARTYINFFRGTPLIWQLGTFNTFLLFALGLKWEALTVGILVFSLNTGSYAAEVFRAGIQSIERGQIEAARSLGMTYLQSMRYAVIPQAVRRVIPPLMNEFVILIKDTALITTLGVALGEQEIYSFARQGYSDTFNATFFTIAAIVYLMITLPLIRAVNYVESKLRSGLTGIVGQ